MFSIPRCAYVSWVPLLLKLKHERSQALWVEYYCSSILSLMEEFLLSFALVEIYLILCSHIEIGWLIREFIFTDTCGLVTDPRTVCNCS